MLGAALALTVGAAGAIGFAATQPPEPASQAADRAVGLLRSGVKRTATALRGYVSSGATQRMLDRSRAWQDDIAAGRRALARSANQPHLRRYIDAVGAALSDLQEQQWYVEDVAQTLGNEPARVTLVLHARPLAESIETLASSLRARFAGAVQPCPSCLAAVATFDTRFTTTRARLKTFVDTGAQADRHRYLQALTALLAAQSTLRDLPHRGPDADRVLARLLAISLRYEAAAQDVVLQRGQPDANVAQHRLNTAVRAAAARVQSSLDALASQLDSLATRHRRRRTARAGLLALLLLLGAWTCYRKARHAA